MSKDNWIRAGYQTFAYVGPSELKVERLARSLQRSKSSFYHFFADLEVFTEHLLEYHLAQAKVIAAKEAQAQTEQELAQILVAHKVDILFNRQLRFHRENPQFEACFHTTNQITTPAFLPLWKKIVGLEEEGFLADLVLAFSSENFYLQITDQTLNEVWLLDYFQNIKRLFRQLRQSNSISTVDGTV